MSQSDRDSMLEKSTTTGTGTYTLGGSPGIIGFQSNDWGLFSRVTDGNTVKYTARGVDPTTGIPNNTGWETGEGTVGSSGTTLARTTFFDSSTGSAISWGAGTRFIFCSPLTEGTLVVRQPGGTVGTDEVQLSHDGSDGQIASKDGALKINVYGTTVVYFGDGNASEIYSIGGTRWSWGNKISMRPTSNQMLLDVGVGFGWGDVSTSAANFYFINAEPGVVCLTKGSSGLGWLQNSAGEAILTSNATNATTTMSNLSGLSITVIAGRKYSFKMILFCADSTAVDGAKFDFDGGSATMTTFRAHGTLFDTALLLSTQTSALATDFAQATMTGDSMLEINGAFTVNAGGTFIPRFAQNNHTAGTLTVYSQSFLDMEDMP